MLYEAEIAVCSEIRTKHIGKCNVRTMQNFWMLSQVVHKFTVRLLGLQG